VEAAYKKKDAGLLVFDSKQVLERVEKFGDLLAPLLSLKQKLPKLAGIERGKAEAAATGLEIAAQAERRPAKRAQAPQRAGARKRARKV
jgi:hypothetical protein